MHRPTRTRQLSIAAAISIAAFAILGFFYIHSFFHWDVWQIGTHWRVSVFVGIAFFYSASNVPKEEFRSALNHLIPLFVLLMAPVWWLIARPTNAPTFPVVTNSMQST